MLAWYIAGPLIGIVFFLLFYLGKSFGISSSLQTLCAIPLKNSKWDYFKVSQRKALWRYAFVAGALLSGVAMIFLFPEHNEKLGAEIEYLFQEDWKGWVLLGVGGLCVGFGARYAGGCTSGHAITGLSFLQWRSLVAVIGFFIGGLLSTHILLRWV